MLRILSRQSFLKRIFFNQSEVDQIILISCCFSCVLLLARVAVTGSLFFSFLVWNLFLAYIPYALSTAITKTNTLSLNKWKLFLFTTCWILFLPNSFYIITDLFHLRITDTMPLWFDLALIVAFAWTGLLFGVLAMRQMEKIFKKWLNPKNELIFIYPIMFLNAFGIYIGRYLRFNSWDVVTNPFPLLNDLLYLMHHPLRNKLEWSMIFCYSFLMTIIYISIKRLNKTP